MQDGRQQDERSFPAMDATRSRADVGIAEVDAEDAEYGLAFAERDAVFIENKGFLLNEASVYVKVFIGCSKPRRVYAKVFKHSSKVKSVYVKSFRYFAKSESEYVKLFMGFAKVKAGFANSRSSFAQLASCRRRLSSRRTPGKFRHDQRDAKSTGRRACSRPGDLAARNRQSGALARAAVAGAGRPAIGQRPRGAGGPRAGCDVAAPDGVVAGGRGGGGEPAGW